MFPRISVIVPCFNAEKWIGHAIDSVLNQSYPNFELLVINDGSTDGTAKILERYGEDVRVIEQRNRGVSASRKKGCEHASGDYIKFLDADDILPPGALHSAANLAIRFPEDIIVGRSNVIDEAGSFLSTSGYNLPLRPSNESLVGGEYLLTQATHSGLWLVPREVLSHASCFDSTIKLGEEYFFTMQLMATNRKMRFVDALVYSVRDHCADGRLSRVGSESDYFRMLSLIKDSVCLIKEHIKVYDHEAIRIIARLCWSRGRHCLRCGFSSAATAYFSFASSLDRRVVPNGRLTYRFLCGLLGPVGAERTLDLLKRTLVSER